MIIAIIGPTLAGKDTLADVLERSWRNRCVVFRPGRECREKFGAAMMAKCANPNAPAETEGYVIHRFRECESEAWLQRDPLVLAGMPRNVSQAKMITGYCNERGLPLLVLRLDVSPVEQRQRMEARDGQDPDALALAQARLGTDRRAVIEVVKCLRGKRGVVILSIPPGMTAQGIRNMVSNRRAISP